METKISVIVPCYNQAQYLDECLQSVFEQTHKTWECIIVDDGSPDNTEDIAKEWELKDSRFKYYKKQNGGVASARNYGIEKSSGEWILPLDGDDKIGSKYLELASQEFAKDYKIIYCNAEFFGNADGNWDLHDYSYQRMLIKNHIFCSGFFRKTFWSEVGGYDTDFLHGHEDWDFWLSILDSQAKVLQLDYVGFFYRRKEISRDVLLSLSSQNQKLTDNLIYKKHFQKYMLYDENPLKNYEISAQKENKLRLLQKEINKNIFSRMIYKIIEKI